jgi:hypothetical protein
MPTLSTAQQWLGDQIVPVLFIGFAILMGIAMVYFSAKSRRASLVRDRSGITAETFADLLSAYGFDPEIARRTYTYLQQAQRVAFPMEPQDDLDRDLGMDGEDVQRTIRELLDETGREYLPGLLDWPLVTVVDLVRYVQASPRREVLPLRRVA